MMNDDPLGLVLAWVIGVSLGGMFFGGLWWTTQKVLSSERPAVWVFGSLLLRMSVALAGFYVVGHDHWEKLLVCLLGFLVARVIATRVAGAEEQPTELPRDPSHAPQS
jgi:F1F0 ATPase subunit 2